MTIACAIGMRREEIDVLISRLKKVWSDMRKKNAAKANEVLDCVQQDSALIFNATTGTSRSSSGYCTVCGRWCECAKKRGKGGAVTLLSVRYL